MVSAFDDHRAKGNTFCSSPGLGYLPSCTSGQSTVQQGPIQVSTGEGVATRETKVESMPVVQWGSLGPRSALTFTAWGSWQVSSPSLVFSFLNCTIEQKDML